MAGATPLQSFDTDKVHLLTKEVSRGFQKRTKRSEQGVLGLLFLGAFVSLIDVCVTVLSTASREREPRLLSHRDLCRGSNLRRGIVNSK